MYCLHCEPYEHRGPLASDKALDHIWLAFRFFGIGKLMSAWPGLVSTLNTCMLPPFFGILRATGVLKETDVTGYEDWMPGFTAVVVREAVENDIPIRNLSFRRGRTTNFYTIEAKGKTRVFEILPHFSLGAVISPDIDDKFELKRLLRKHDLPNVEGRVFSSEARAVRYARKIGFPLVVKPRENSLSKHVTCDIGDERALRDAIRIAKKIGLEFIVERFVRGSVYRVTMLGGEVVACCLREPANVVGDGVHTVEELIRRKNADARRGEPGHKNSTLRKIVMSPSAIDLLSRQGVGLHSVLPTDRKVYVHHKVILAGGADIHDRTDEVHEATARMFQKAAGLCNAPIIGFDFICEDISEPYHEQECAIIEANSCPSIDMHHFPVTGQVRDVAGRLLRHCLESMDRRSFPPRRRPARHRA